ncbi:peroxide stress regulator PerR, FUR family [Lachnospiraceae bacterium KM106-2]|nr:peroxide stress regulator PerR, FUR family [Lachnospiraceae bacterium KM106-2]
MTTLKFSRQRESIKDYLMHTADHPTADTVYQNIRKIYPKISLGTVYRNLNLLVELGEINKLSCGEDCDRFDGNIKPHYHVICKDCGNVYDIEMDPIDHINVIANAHFKGKVTGHQTVFFGTCENCIKKH